MLNVHSSKRNTREWSQETIPKNPLGKKKSAFSKAFGVLFGSFRARSEETIGIIQMIGRQHTCLLSPTLPSVLGFLATDVPVRKKKSAALSSIRATAVLEHAVNSRKGKGQHPNNIETPGLCDCWRPFAGVTKPPVELQCHFFSSRYYQQIWVIYTRGDIDISLSTAVNAVLEVYLLQRCHVVNLRMLESCRVWYNTPVEIHRLRTTLA